jgi:hypothetical protein
MQCPEGERKSEGRLRILSLEDGNGLSTVNIPGSVTNAVEDGSWRPNGLEEEFRISAKR